MASASRTRPDECEEAFSRFFDLDRWPGESDAGLVPVKVEKSRKPISSGSLNAS